MNKWQIFRGGDVSCFLEEIGGDIDLFMLDTVHIHPWETLNFLCALPFMKNDSWTVLHDITLFTHPKNRGSLACRYLFSCVVSDEKITPIPEDDKEIFANIGAFKVSAITKKYVNNLLEALLIPWDSEVKAKDMKTISAIIKKYYSPEQYEFFCKVLELQEQIRKLDETEGLSFYSAAKAFLKAWQPKLFRRMKHLKHSLKG